ncbi:MAG: alkene reductase [Polyangiales bacterium]
MRLLEPFAHPRLPLQNRVVMAPMTRSRAVEANTPNALMATYYAQRAGAGLIVTEGTSPAPAGLGYARIPGLYNDAQVAGWRGVTDAVHARGARIFVQLMHTGRVAHRDNLPAGAEVVGPVSGALAGTMYVDGAGPLPHTPARGLTAPEVEAVVAQHAASARLAVAAGFDGVELHGANGYLLEQFLNANVNTRDDAWGGDAARRNAFALAVARACAEAIGAERVGIRLSPYGVFNGTGPYAGVDAQYLELVRALGDLGLLYVHLVDHHAMGTPPLPAGFARRLRDAFGGVFIASGGFDGPRAEATLQAGDADLVAFGRPWLANPDLIERLRDGAALNAPDPSTFYTPGPRGYTDYPTR